MIREFGFGFLNLAEENRYIAEILRRGRSEHWDDGKTALSIQ